MSWQAALTLGRVIATKIRSFCTGSFEHQLDLSLKCWLFLPNAVFQNWQRVLTQNCPVPDAGTAEDTLSSLLPFLFGSFLACFSLLLLLSSLVARQVLFPFTPYGRLPFSSTPKFTLHAPQSLLFSQQHNIHPREISSSCSTIYFHNPVYSFRGSATNKIQ